MLRRAIPFFLSLIPMACASPMEVASQSAALVPYEKYCPALGALNAGDFSGNIWTNESGTRFIVLRGKDGKPVNMLLQHATEARSIATETDFNGYLGNYRAVCGADRPPFYPEIKFAQYLKMPEDWKVLPKDKPSVIFRFLSQVPESPDACKELRKEFANTLDPMIIDRVERYIRKNFPEQASLVREHIWYGGEVVDSEYTLRELFYMPVLGRDPQSGLKLERSQWFLEGSTDNFGLHIKLPGEQEAILSFERSNGRLWVTGFQQGFQRNPRNWQLAAKAVFDMASTFPKGDHWDWPFIDSL